MRHDLEHISQLPEQLGGEVEVAVLEGVPMVREAVLFHRPTGTVLSANLLLAMSQNTLVRLKFEHTNSGRFTLTLVRFFSTKAQLYYDAVVCPCKVSKEATRANSSAWYTAAVSQTAENL